MKEKIKWIVVNPDSYEIISACDCVAGLNPAFDEKSARAAARKAQSIGIQAIAIRDPQPELNPYPIC